MGVDNEYFVYALSMQEMRKNYQNIRSENPENLNVLIKKISQAEGVFAAFREIIT